MRGDVSDVSSKMRNVENSLQRVGTAATGGTLSLGRLGNQFSNLAGKIAGVHPIVGNLANVMGDFAIGGVVTVGVLAGLAAIAVAYDKLTEASTDAMKASDKLIESLLRAARVRALGVGGEQRAAIEDLTKGGAAHTQRAGFLMGAASANPQIAGILNFFAGKDVDKVVQGSAAMQEAVNQLGLAIAASNEKIADEAKSLADKRRAAAEKDAAEELQLQKQISDLKLKIVLDELRKIADLQDYIKDHTTFSGMPAKQDISMPFEGLNQKQKEQLRVLGVLVDDNNDNAKATQNTILQSASIITNALNIGGSGRGSGIGSALGSVLGSGLTVGAGVLTSGLWGIAGGLLGSAIGGLFDHKKSVDANTNALNRVANLLNAPSGFKGAYYTYQAEDARRMYQQQQETARREATRGGSTGFALRAGA